MLLFTVARSCCEIVLTVNFFLRFCIYLLLDIEGVWNIELAAGNSFNNALLLYILKMVKTNYADGD